MKILILDNYDSFTYNLAQLVRHASGTSEVTFDVILNDQITVQHCEAYDKFIFSPGPGLPSEAGILTQVIEHYAERKSMLGVCLGHQAIAEVFGGSLRNLPRVQHGVPTTATILLDDYLFSGLPKTFSAGRYHSWVVNAVDFPGELECIAHNDDLQIMALRHKSYDIRGVQFHPESIMTPDGLQIVRNFIEGP